MSVPLVTAEEPGKQDVQTLASELPGIGLALPGAHKTHDALLDAPSAGLYVPALQLS